MSQSAQSDNPSIGRPANKVNLWIAVLVLVTLFWGNSFIAVKHLVEFVTPLQLVTVRFVPVGLIFGAMVFLFYGRRIHQLVRAHGVRLALMGLTSAVLYNIFLGLGTTRVAAGTASLIIALNPTFTYLLSVLFLGERFNWQRALGLAIAFGGLYIIIRWGSGRPVTLEDVRYALIILLSPASWAVYTTLGKPLMERHSPLLVTGVAQMFAGLFSVIFISPDLVARLATVPSSFWWALVFLTIPCTVFGYVVWGVALNHLPAGRVASFIYLVPMFAVTFGYLLLDEPITLALLGGAAILIGGVWMANRRWTVR